MTKSIKVIEGFDLKKPLKNVLNNNWDKILFRAKDDNIEYFVTLQNLYEKGRENLFEVSKKNTVEWESFKSEEIFNDFKDLDIGKKAQIIVYPSNRRIKWEEFRNWSEAITVNKEIRGLWATDYSFKNKEQNPEYWGLMSALFIKKPSTRPGWGGYKIRNKRAWEFLKKHLGDVETEISYDKGEYLSEEFKYDKIDDYKKFIEAGDTSDSTPPKPIESPTKPIDPIDKDKPIEVPISTPVPTTNPIIEKKPVVEDPKTDNSKPIVGLPTIGLTDEQRVMLAEHPILKKRNAELISEKEQIRKDKDKDIDDLRDDNKTKDILIGNLQGENAGLRAEKIHLSEKAEKVDDWNKTFGYKTPSEVKALIDNPKFTSDQQEALKNYSTVKTNLEDWKKAFNEFSGPDEAYTAYKEAIKNQKPIDHDKVRDDLTEWEVAFPKYKFPKKPEDIRKELDKLKNNQTPSDYQDKVKKLEVWIKLFSEDPDLHDKEPEQVKNFVEGLKQELVKVKTNLLVQYNAGIIRSVNNIFNIRLKNYVDKNSLSEKYGGKTINTILNQGLTLENWEDCKKNLDVVISICATEKAEEWSEQVKKEMERLPKQDYTAKIRELKEFLEAVEEQWGRTFKITNKDNPFYLPIIENQHKDKERLDNLKTYWNDRASHVTTRRWHNVEETYIAYMEQK